jgi:hypothetical protein
MSGAQIAIVVVAVAVGIVLPAFLVIRAKGRPTSSGAPPLNPVYSHIDPVTGQTVIDEPGTVHDIGTEHTSGPGPTDAEKKAKAVAAAGIVPAPPAKTDPPTAA